MKRALENTMGNEENAGRQHFLLFQQCLQLYNKEKCHFSNILNLSYANDFNLVMPKNLRFGNGLSLFERVVKIVRKRGDAYVTSIFSFFNPLPDDKF